MENVEDITKEFYEQMDIIDKKMGVLLTKEKVDYTKGSEHYKTSGIQPFDVYQILPCKGFTPFMIFCAFNVLKYVWRICNNKPNMKEDIGKLIHYAETFKSLIRDLT